MDSFYSTEELKGLGFKSIGEHVLVSKKCSIYGAENITIGNHVRIDDFAILSGNITLGSYVHISAYATLYGGNSMISVGDCSNVSTRVIIYAITDDFSGEFLVGSMIDNKYRNVITGPVVIERFVQLGGGVIILPNVMIHEGAAIAAMSLVNKSLPAWYIYAGIPCKAIKERSRKSLELYQHMIEDAKGKE